MRGAFGVTPVRQHLMSRGVYAGPPPPRDAERLTLVVRDVGGLDCEAAKYPLLALRGTDCDLWVTHHEAGSFHLVEGGRTTEVGEILSARFKSGEELTLSATGADARRALDVLREMLGAPPEDRRRIYRRRYRQGAA